MIKLFFGKKSHLLHEAEGQKSRKQTAGPSIPPKFEREKFCPKNLSKIKVLCVK